MTNLLEIFSIPGKIKPEEFKPFFIDSTKRVFYEKARRDGSEMVPMAFLLTPAETLGIYPDFKDDAHKSASMQQLKFLAKISQARAYGMVSEVYMKALPVGKDQDEEHNFLKDLNYQVSLLPDRIECLMCFIEVKSMDKIKTSLCSWEISTDTNGRRSLKNFKDKKYDELQGRMTGILT